MGHNELSDAGSFENKGFLSNGTKCLSIGTDSLYTYQPAVISKEGEDCLDSIISTCRKKNIKLMFTYAPEYKYNLQKYCTNFPVFISFISTVSKKYTIPFYREDSLAMCQEPCYFANYGHVNLPGAVAYSKILGQRLKNLPIDKL